MFRQHVTEVSDGQRFALSELLAEQKNKIEYNIEIQPDLIGVFKVRSWLWSHGHQEKVESKYGDEDANSFGRFQCHVIVAIKIVLKL